MHYLEMEGQLEDVNGRATSNGENGRWALITPKASPRGGPQHSKTSMKQKETQEVDKEVNQVKIATPPRKEKPKHTPPPSFIEGHRGDVFYFGNQISTGGYSRCYLVKNRQGQLYAAKTISRSTIRTESLVRQIRREVYIHERLDHPGIVRFRQLIESETHIILVLDYCPNKTLTEYLAARGRCREDEAGRMLDHIFQAVHYLHSQFIHHGDLKLGNIFLDGHMHPKVGDFGFSKQLKPPHPERTSLCGTPAYMAPEIIDKNCKFGLPADIWSLGVIAYALIYGVTAFDATNVDAVYARIRAYDLKFPKLVPPVSNAAIELMSLMLNPYPQCRPTSRALINNRWVQQFSSRLSMEQAGLDCYERGTVAGFPGSSKTLRSRFKNTAARKTVYLRSVFTTQFGKIKATTNNLDTPP